VPQSVVLVYSISNIAPLISFNHFTPFTAQLARCGRGLGARPPGKFLANSNVLDDFCKENQRGGRENGANPFPGITIFWIGLHLLASPLPLAMGLIKFNFNSLNDSSIFEDLG
jgi:hypothetical protein